MTGPFPQVARVAAGSAVLTRRHGRWLLAGGWKSAIGRVLGSVMAAWMLGGCAIATPVTWWVAVFTWVVAAYRVSDSSATPPPLPPGLDSDEYAGETEEVDRVEWGSEGVRCTIHTVRRGVNEP